MMKIKSQQLVRMALFAVIGIAAVLAALSLWRYYTQAPWTRDGRIRGDVMRISADVSGLVKEVLVQDNQPVKQGQILFSIDPARFEIAVEQAKANLARAQANLANSRQQRLSAEATINQAQASVQAAQAEAEKARRDLARIEQLQNDNAVSKQEQDRYRAVKLEAQANLAKAQANIEVEKQNLSAVATGRQGLLAEVASAQAALDLAQLNLARTQVKAPDNGRLANFDLKAGNYVSAGQAIAALLDPKQFYVVGYFEETKLSRIRIGDAVTVQLIGDSRQIKGHVQGIAAGIEDRERTSSSSMLANINPTFNWVRLAQRVPVRVTLDDVPDSNMLVAGRTVTVHIDESRNGKKPPSK
ncbi:HlyD family secretion protein [Alkanindiges sp. WGS2144]|uniref:HlyD family secretion protein n=1 Tax=Alkanindiges sp. WGS2144 TaxID=3366808 RepID=UPI003751FAC8